MTIKEEASKMIVWGGWALGIGEKWHSAAMRSIAVNCLQLEWFY